MEEESQGVVLKMVGAEEDLAKGVCFRVETLNPERCRRSSLYQALAHAGWPSAPARRSP